MRPLRWLCTSEALSILNTADMTTDGAVLSWRRGVRRVLCVRPPHSGPAATMLATPPRAGFITSFLQTAKGCPPFWRGIVTNIGLYSINLMVMGTSNLSIFRSETSLARVRLCRSWYKLYRHGGHRTSDLRAPGPLHGHPAGPFHRATGDNADYMVRAITPSIHLYDHQAWYCCESNHDRTIRGHGGPITTPLPGQRRHRYGGAGPGMHLLVIGETLIGKGQSHGPPGAGGIALRQHPLPPDLFGRPLGDNVPEPTKAKLVSAVIIEGSANCMRFHGAGCGRPSRCASAAPQPDERRSSGCWSLKSFQDLQPRNRVHEKKALCGVNLKLERGDFAAIVGLNGAGNPPLFNAIVGDFHR